MKKRLIRWLIILTGIYMAGGVSLYFIQDIILLHPIPLGREHNYEFKEPHLDTTIHLSQNRNLNIVQFKSTTGATRGVVLYFHGNRKNISWYARFAPHFTSLGYEVWMPDYPGFGKSTGKFTEAALYEYALLVYQMAAARFRPDSITLYGKSMGTGIAAQLAATQPAHQLILETPYYSMTTLVEHYAPIYPVSLILHYRLPTYEYLSGLQIPVSIFHGTNDEIIPYSNAIRLRPVLKPSDNFITIPNGRHNDLAGFPAYQQGLRVLLD